MAAHMSDIKNEPYLPEMQTMAFGPGMNRDCM